VTAIKKGKKGKLEKEEEEEEEGVVRPSKSS
jgi:hypothetical protein